MRLGGGEKERAAPRQVRQWRDEQGGATSGDGGGDGGGEPARE